MIEFNDSFSQASVAEAMCAHSGLAKLISQQLMLPGFAYAHDVEGRRIGGPLVAPNPVLHKTTLFVSPRDMREHLPREINFARFRCAANARPLLRAGRQPGRRPPSRPSSPAPRPSAEKASYP